jgi:hypothetical protein
MKPYNVTREMELYYKRSLFVKKLTVNLLFVQNTTCVLYKTFYKRAKTVLCLPYPLVRNWFEHLHMQEN